MSSVIYIFIARLIPAITAFVSITITVRAFDIVAYGQYAIALGVLSFLSLFNGLGYTDYLLSRKDDVSGEVALAFAFNFKLYATLLCLLAAVFLILSGFYSKETVNIMIWVLSFELLIKTIEDLVFFSAQVKERFLGFMRARAILAILVLFCKLIFLYTSNDILSYVRNYTITSFILFFIAFKGELFGFVKLLEKYPSQLFLKHARQNVKGIGCYILVSISYYVYFSSDAFILGVLSDEENAAYYSLAFSILAAVLIPAGVIWSYIISKPTEYYFNLIKGKNFRFHVLLLAVSAGLALYFGSKVVFYLVSKESPILNEISIMFALYVTMRYGNVFFELFISLMKREDTMRNIRLAGAIINLSLNLMFIKKYGAIGAAASTLFTEFVIFAVYYGCVSFRRGAVF